MSSSSSSDAEDAALAHAAIVATWRALSAAFDDARLEDRGDLLLALCPSLPLPQSNGPWVVADTEAAVAALPAAIAEVEAAGATPWVQTRSGHEHVRAAARELGFTHVERLPGMALRPGELRDAAADVEIGPVGDDEAEEVVAMLAAAFEAPVELFERLALAYTVEGATWVAGRVGGRVVSTAGSFTVDGVTGIFNVATPSELRGRGYGAAVTAHVAREALAAGAPLVYLQSSASGHGVYRRLGFRDVEDYLLLGRPA